MEKYVDERALRHFRDKSVEKDIQPKIDQLQTNLNNVNTSLTNSMNNYVEQLCRVETGGALLHYSSTKPTTTMSLPFAGLYSARLVVWLNGTTSRVPGSQVFSISVSGANLVQVSLGNGNETASGSIALDIMPMTSAGKLRPFNVVASGCVRVGDDVTLVQGFRALDASSSLANLAITIAPTAAIGGSVGGTARCGFSYSALYDAKSLVPVGN